MKAAVFLAATTALAAFGQPHPAPDEARIAEIAGWLADEPSASGARITDRKAWDRYSGTPAGKKIIARAADIAAHDVPDMPPVWYLEYFTTDYIKDGDSRRWREPFWKRASNLSTLVLGECLENKGRFLKRITQYLELMPTECAWTEPIHDRPLTTFDGTRPVIDLGVAERCNVLAYALDWLKDRIPATTRDKVVEAMRERAFRIYLSGGENWSHNNWNAVCNGCVIRAALAIEPDRKVRARFVEAAERTAPYFLDGFRADGYCGEGLDYWNYGYSRFLPLVLDVRRATGGKVDLGKLPRAREAMAYAYGFQLEPFVAPRFSDGMASVPSTSNLALGRLIWPDLTCARAEKFDPVSPSFQCMPFLAFDDGAVRLQMSSADRPFELPLRTWFPDAQLYFGRPKPGAAGIAFSACMKGGWNNDPHNHNDVGTYVVMLGGVEMVSDPGGEEYTRRTFSPRRYESKILNSYGHPVPVVGGELQRTGSRYRAKVVAQDFGDKVCTLSLELKGAYEVKTLKSLVRTFAWDRSGNMFTVKDRFEFSEPTSFEDPYLVYDGKPCTPEIAVVPAGHSLKEEEIPNPGRLSPRRIAVIPTAPVKEAEVTFTFASHPAVL